MIRCAQQRRCPFLALSEQQARAKRSKHGHRAKVENRSILRTASRDSTSRRNPVQSATNVSFSAYEPGGRTFESCRAHHFPSTFRRLSLAPECRLEPLALFGSQTPSSNPISVLRHPGERSCVPHRHLHGLMAEQFRHGAQGCATHHHPGREGVPQVVPSVLAPSVPRLYKCDRRVTPGDGIGGRVLPE